VARHGGNSDTDTGGHRGPAHASGNVPADGGGGRGRRIGGGGGGRSPRPDGAAGHGGRGAATLPRPGGVKPCGGSDVLCCGGPDAAFLRHHRHLQAVLPSPWTLWGHDKAGVAPGSSTLYFLGRPGGFSLSNASLFLAM